MSRQPGSKKSASDSSMKSGKSTDESTSKPKQKPPTNAVEKKPAIPIASVPSRYDKSGEKKAEKPKENRPPLTPASKSSAEPKSARKSEIKPLSSRSNEKSESKSQSKSAEKPKSERKPPTTPKSADKSKSAKIDLKSAKADPKSSNSDAKSSKSTKSETKSGKVDSKATDKSKNDKKDDKSKSKDKSTVDKKGSDKKGDGKNMVPRPEVSNEVLKQKAGPHCASNVHSNLPVQKVTVHPLVLLSVVDHFNRVKKTQTVKRVVGVLLGSMKNGKVLDIGNSFAVPFDEDDKDKNTWFLDMDYLESMYSMFYKVAAKEKIVGWYHTGPKLHKNDIAINEQLKRFTNNPVLVIIEAEPKDIGLPTEAYLEVQEVHDDGTPPIKTFEHVPSEIGAEEAEEVGVEHLLRDIKDQTAGTLSQRVTDQLMGLHGLQSQLQDIEKYLRDIAAGTLPINHPVIYYIQEVLNLLPDVTHPEYVTAQNVQTNDQLMCVYMGSLVRSVIALHNLIDNKLALQKAERDREAGIDTEKKKEEKEEKKAFKEPKRARTK